MTMGDEADAVRREGRERAAAYAAELATGYDTLVGWLTEIAREFADAAARRGLRSNYPTEEKRRFGIRQRFSPAWRITIDPDSYGQGIDVCVRADGSWTWEDDGSPAEVWSKLIAGRCHDIERLARRAGRVRALREEIRRYLIWRLAER